MKTLVPILAVFFGLCLQASARAEPVIVALGTSLTTRGSWPDELVAALKPCLGDGVRLERIAAAGKGSEWGLGAIDRVIAARPDVVLIEFAINDANILNGVSLARSRANHLAMIEALRKALPKVRIALVTTNPAFGPRGWIRPWLAQYYELYRDISAAERVTLIDLSAQWHRSLAGARERQLLPDGLHPTDAANRDVILPMLESAVLTMLQPSGSPCQTRSKLLHP